MAFDINKARTYKDSGSGRFDIEKARNFGRPTDQPAPQPLKANAAFGALREQEEKRKFERTQVRLPFSQRSATMGGANNFLTRGFLNIASRAMEDIVVGGLKVAATVRGRDITTSRPITNEPTLTGGDPVVQSTFEPMSRAATDRIAALDVERPEKRRLNLIQGATEEVFLPLLNAVDIVGLSSLAVRLTRKLTFSKKATEALSTLNMGLLSDTSETGVRAHVTNEVQRNVDLLAREKITPEVFETRLNGIGTAFDTLTEAPTTRFGRVGERINSMATALEMERKIGRATDPTFIQIKNALQEAMNKAEVPTPVKQVDEAVETTTEVSKDFNLADNKINFSKQGFRVSEVTETIDGKSTVVREEKSIMKTEDLSPELNTRYQSALKAKEDARGTGVDNVKKAGDEFQEVVNDIAKEMDLTDVNKGKPAVVNTTPERPKSKLALRINESLPDGNKIDEFYDAITIKGELDEAGEAITKNPTKALTEALDGGQPLPKRAARLMEFAQAAKDRGDTAVQSALLSKMRVLGTDIAQGLNMFKAFGLSNPETEFLETVMAARLKKIAITAEDISRAGSHSKAYNAKVYAPVKEEINNVTKRAFKVADAQKLFDDLTC
jgi:hypothetical protein